MPIPLNNAWLCVNCETVGDSAVRCEKCGDGNSLMSLGRVFSLIKPKPNVVTALLREVELYQQ